MRADIRIEFKNKDYDKVATLLELLDQLVDKSDRVYENIRSVKGGVLFGNEEVEDVRKKFID